MPSSKKPDLQPENVTILVVEDDPQSREAVAQMLRSSGYKVVTAESGPQAIDILLADDPPCDLMVVDFIMPGMNGYQILERLREEDIIDTLPIIITSSLDETDALVRCIEIGADDYIRKPYDPVLFNIRVQAALARYQIEESERSHFRRIEKEKQLTDDLLNAVIPIGVALSAEKDFNRLLEMILLEAKRLCNADGGTLYLRTHDDMLKFMVVRNDTLQIKVGGTGGTSVDVPFPPLRMYDEGTRVPNHKNVATHVALTGQTFSIADAYSEADEFDFSGTMEFDRRSNYRSSSFLNAPLKNVGGEVIGVLQLLNAKDRDTGEIIPFDPSLRMMIESLSALAAVALEAYQREAGLRQQIEQLRIEIDQVKRQQQVAEVTETAQFKALRQKAKALREEASKND